MLEEARTSRRRKDSPLATATGELREYLLVVVADPCAYCGAAASGFDHIVAQQCGGPDDWTNLTSACARCNSRKRTSSLLGFLGWLAEESSRATAEALLAPSKAWRSVGI